MVCVGVRFEDALDRVTLLLDQGEQGIRRGSCDSLRAWIVVENWINNHSF